MSEYQGRLYIDSISEVLDKDGSLNKAKVKERMAEIVSEAMKYCFGDENYVVKTNKAMWDMIRKAIT